MFVRARLCDAVRAARECMTTTASWGVKVCGSPLGSSFSRRPRVCVEVAPAAVKPALLTEGSRTPASGRGCCRGPVAPRRVPPPLARRASRRPQASWRSQFSSMPSDSHIDQSLSQYRPYLDSICWSVRRAVTQSSARSTSSASFQRGRHIESAVLRMRSKHGSRRAADATRTCSTHWRSPRPGDVRGVPEHLRVDMLVPRSSQASRRCCGR